VLPGSGVTVLSTLSNFTRLLLLVILGTVLGARSEGRGVAGDFNAGIDFLA
jgi:hypothetical protein